MKKMHLLQTALAGAVLASAVLPAGAAELRMSWWGGDSRHIATQEALKICGEKHGHTIKPEFTGFGGYLEKLTTQMAGGTEADIMQVNWPWLPLFSRDGNGFYDLRQIEALDLANWTDDQLAAADVDGKLNGLPISTTGRLFFYNATTFGELGMNYPTTWDEFFETAAAYREQLGDGARLFNAGKDTARLMVLLYSTQKTGEDLVDDATNRVAWDAETLTEAIEFYARMVETGAVDSLEQEAGGGNQQLYEKRTWAEGLIGSSYEWDSTYFKFSDPLDEGEELDSAMPITMEGGASQGIYRKASMLFSISKNSADPEAAGQIVNCLLNEPEGIDALKDTRGLPASKAAFDRLSQAEMIKPQILKANKIIMEAEGPALSPYNEHPEVMSIFADTLEEFAYGMLSAEEAAEILIEDINGVLEDFD